MVHEQRDGAVARLTFDRPEHLNAFTVTAYREVRQALDRAAADAAVHVVVLAGSGRAFSAGADRSLLDGSAPDAAEAGPEFERFLDTLAGFPKPLVAAVHGFAVGIGCTLLLYCDLVLVAASARLRLPFTELGIVPEAGSSALLPQRGRWPDVVWSMLSSEWIDADAAVRLGLAWRVVADDALADETDATAATLAALDPAAVAATKELLVTGRHEVARAAIERELAAVRALRQLP